MNTPLPALRSVVVTAVLAASPVFAQTTPTPAAAKKSEVVELSPFQVHAEENRGYIASETMSGTRVATPIKDLPYTVNVVTSEFFDDFGMFQLDDSLTQVGGLTGLDIGGGFNLRGFSSSSQLRDGFYRLGRYGQTNIDRLEIIKGPNAGIYGRTSPGGMVNMISKAPRAQDSTKLTFRYGTYDTAQGTIEKTGSIGAHTAYIAILSQFNRAADMDWFHIRENQGFVAVQHDFNDGSHLLLSAEYFMQYRNAPQPSAPTILDRKGTASTADDQVIGYAKNLARVNPYGPNSQLFRGSNTLYGTWDKRLNAVFNFRVGAQAFQANRWDYNQNTGWGQVTINSTTASANLTSARGATPNRGLIFESGGGLQADLVGKYDSFNGAVTNKTLLTADFNDYYRYDPTRSAGNATALAAWSAARTVQLNADYSPAGPVAYYTGRLDDGQFTGTYSRLTRRRATVVGGLLRQETHLLHDSLLVYFGARYDHVHFNERDYTATFNGVTGTVANPNRVRRDVNQFKPNFGALYKVQDNFRVYANYSESYFINQTDNPSDIASASYKPETAKGVDYGIKGSFFHDRLNYTIGGYAIRRYAVRVTDSVETPAGSGNYVNITRPDGDQKDTGLEADINWSINANFATGLSYGHVNAIYTDFGTAYPRAVGRHVQNITPTNGGAYVKYSATTGALKGFSANVGVTYMAETPTEAPNAGDPAAGANGVQAATSTNQWALTIPAFTLWNLGLHYTTHVSDRYSHTVSLNINNVFDKDYLKVNKNLGDGRGIYFSYTLQFSRL
ncbi:MAG TPA: TonB-dependent receptor [Lacunisphaera sp.]|jgi:outer membrane receptor protein involved in Fe transport|nr:TonB-dependent receptor [Lacunisphaera sp.]